MRTFLIVIALLFALPAAAADRVLKGGGVTLRLQQTACSVAAPLAGLKPEHVERFHDGRADMGSAGSVRFCWTDQHTDGSPAQTMIYVWDENGNGGWLVLDGFKEDPGV